MDCLAFPMREPSLVGKTARGEEAAHHGYCSVEIRDDGGSEGIVEVHIVWRSDDPLQGVAGEVTYFEVLTVIVVGIDFFPVQFPVDLQTAQQSRGQFV